MRARARVDYVSNFDGVVIRTARKQHRCDCRLPQHHGFEPWGAVQARRPRFCPNRIEPGDRYPECLTEAAAYESGARYCPACAPDQLGDWISEVQAAASTPTPEGVPS